MNWIFGLLGATVGGWFGYFVFKWLQTQGFYAMVLPGASIGLGCALACKDRSFPLSVFCAVAAILWGLAAEWLTAPFAADESMGYFVKNIFSLNPATLLMIAVGGVVSYFVSSPSTLKRND